MTSQEKSRLMDLLRDGAWGVRQAACQALGALVQTDPEVRAAVLPLLRDGDCDVRQAACQALGALAKDGGTTTAAAAAWRAFWL